MFRRRKEEGTNDERPFAIVQRVSRNGLIRSDGLRGALRREEGGGRELLLIGGSERGKTTAGEGGGVTEMSRGMLAR
jgi:hypothetical protein